MNGADESSKHIDFRKTILIVEDEAIVALSEAKILERNGYDVVIAESGERAVRIVEQSPDVDLILMDINLGRGIDGTDAAERILETHNIPIIFLSSHTEPEVVEKTEGITSYGYVVKTSGETVLLMSVKMAFRLYESRLRERESEQRLRALVENSTDLIVMIDSDGTILATGASVERILGYRSDELAGQRFTGITHPDDLATVSRTVGNITQSDRIIERTLVRVRHRDGRWRLLDFAGAPRVENERVSELVIIGRDVTDEEEAREALDFRLRFEQLISALSAGFINLPTDEIENGIRHAIEQVGRFFDADRVHVFWFSDYHRGDTSVYEWCREGVAPHRDRLAQVPIVEEFAWYVEQMRALEPILVNDVDDLSDAAAAEKAELRRQEVVSMVAVPMERNRRITGVVELHSSRPERRFSEELIGLLKITGEMITDAIGRSDADTALRTSELRYRTLFEKAGDGLFLFDGLTVIDCNPETLRMFRCTRDEIVGKPPYWFFPEYQPDGRVSADVAASLLREAAAGVDQRFEWLHKRADGTLFYGEVTLTPVNLPEGKRVLAILRDSSERIKAHERLRKSEEQYRRLFDNSPAIHFVYDTEFRIIDVNRAFENCIGYSKSELIGTSFVPLIAKEQHSVLFQRVSDVAQGRELESVEWHVIARDGTIRILYVGPGNRQQINLPGQVGGYLAELVDVTELRAAQGRELAQREELYQASKLVSLGTLLSGVAHEINNPNNYIRMSVGNLRDFWSDARNILDRLHLESSSVRLGGIPYDRSREMVGKMIENILDGSERIEKLVSDLKDFVRPGGKAKREVTDANSIVDSAVNITRSTISSATGHFGLVHSGSASFVLCDRQQVEQVVINLITNACQALEHEDQRIDIEVIADKEPWVDIVVRDTGRGIPVENLQQITDPFFTTKRQEGGTGLGLAVSLRIASEHGGKLEFESEVGRGTTATFRLPSNVDRI